MSEFQLSGQHHESGRILRSLWSQRRYRWVLAGLDDKFSGADGVIKHY